MKVICIWGDDFLEGMSWKLDFSLTEDEIISAYNEFMREFSVKNNIENIPPMSIEIAEYLINNGPNAEYAVYYKEYQDPDNEYDSYSICDWLVSFVQKEMGKHKWKTDGGGGKCGDGGVKFIDVSDDFLRFNIIKTITSESNNWNEYLAFYNHIKSTKKPNVENHTLPIICCLHEYGEFDADCLDCCDLYAYGNFGGVYIGRSTKGIHVFQDNENKIDKEG